LWKEIGEKAGYKKLVKLITGVNFANILFAGFCTKVYCTPFLFLQFGFVIFWKKKFGK